MKMLLAALIVLPLGGLAWFGAEREIGAQDASEPRAQESFELKALLKGLDEKGGPWIGFLDRPALSAGIYRLKAGATDGQSPHEHDELYYVIEGKATLTAGVEELPVDKGSIVYVKREVEHRFHDIEKDLVVLVFFAKSAGGPR